MSEQEPRSMGCKSCPGRGRRCGGIQCDREPSMMSGPAGATRSYQGLGKRLEGESQEFLRQVTNQKGTRRILISKDPKDPSVGLGFRFPVQLRLEVTDLGSGWLRASWW